jgi:hypothetical protein
MADENVKRATPENQRKALKLLADGKSLSEISEALFGDRNHLNPARRMLAAAGIEYTASPAQRTVTAALEKARAHFSKSATLYKAAGKKAVR